MCTPRLKTSEDFISYVKQKLKKKQNKTKKQKQKQKQKKKIFDD